MAVCYLLTSLWVRDRLSATKHDIYEEKMLRLACVS
jgi:hypothetical protein